MADSSEMDIKEMIISQKLILDRTKKMKINYGKDSPARKTKPYLELRISLLTEKMNAFKEMHKIIMTEYATEISELDYYKNDTYGEFEDIYVELMADMQQYKENTFGLAVQNTATVEINNDRQRPKLPTIHLPKFSGNYTEWTSFYDLFLTMIHNNEEMPKVQKLYYLKTHVTEEAEQLLRHVMVTEANYDAAWETLVNRYENKRVLINTQLKLLLGQRSLLVENAEGIKTLLDTTSECLKALQNLEVNIRYWDPIIIYLTTQKLPTETHQLWEHSISSKREMPTFHCLKEFLEARFRTLEVVGALHFREKEKFNKFKANTSNAKSLHSQVCDNSCYYCQERHDLKNCVSYLQQDVNKRISIAKEKDLCLNCLTKGHYAQKCFSEIRCKFCKMKHHHLLHIKGKLVPLHSRKTIKDYEDHGNESKNPRNGNNLTSLHNHLSTKVLLATAIIHVKSPNGILQLRALLDQGSQTSFITETAAQRLKLKGVKIDATVKGIGNSNQHLCHKKVTLDICSTNDGSIITEALIMKRITDLIPTEKTVANQWTHLKGLKLADPGYLNPGKIDVLLGAEVYAEILLEGLKVGPPNTPVAQNTIFGWIISGKTSNKLEKCLDKNIVVNFHNRIDTDSILKKFWEIEELPVFKENTEEEIQCENIYRNTHKRNKLGRYIVHLPFKINSEKTRLGNSQRIALARFIQTEKRMEKDEELKESYSNCIKEYQQLNHMERIEDKAHPTRGCNKSKLARECYYLPHHPVMKEQSSSTKLRVVFNASQKTDNNISLNDMLITGPTIQDDLKAILLRWRVFQYAYSADIEKMYRQVMVTRAHQDLQRILWRESYQEKIEEFRLTRVTFGFTSAAFLAIRSLRQLAYDEGDKYPLVKDILLNDFYVDNVLSGSHSLEEAKQQREQLIALLDKGGFPLKKWSANHKRILEGLSDEYKELPNEIDIGSMLEVKTLGILWNTESDFFCYKIEIGKFKAVHTKRTAASIVAKIFDPLGWCAPIIIVGKILLQGLWLLEIGWDDNLTSELCTKFQRYLEDIQEINKLKIPRWIGTNLNSEFELHGFCDASTKAYAAAIYIKVMTTEGPKVHLLAASTKVAPIKTISLPRLELCGALLLAKLCNYYKEALKLKRVKVYAWTDSRIVLAWLNGHPNKWKCFVANRVTEIKQMMIGATWRHVPSKDNPADCASRGVRTSELLKQVSWWSGPEWLKESTAAWPRTEFSATTEEIKSVNVLTTIVNQIPEFIHKFSKLNVLIRVTAYVWRFVNRCKKIACPSSRKLEVIELKNALSWLIKTEQRFAFTRDIKELISQQKISRTSRLIKLYPFLDKEGRLRVGGRLQRSDLTYDNKHPIILDCKSFLTELIIRQTHLETLHGGPQLTLNSLRQRYWILGARNIVRQIINQCVTCIKQKSITGQQLMGSLPSARVTKSRPFSHTGVDYCGPFNIKLNKGRGVTTLKGYIAIFICLAIKAIHIELVSDLSTPSFLAALKRFTSRRGLPSDIYSDCGSNFVGASRVIEKDLAKCLKNQQEMIAEQLANEEITWHFNPPSAPHFGGLWEVGVKSTKYHLKRLLNNRLLTFEEMNTLLTQIEANLNSRPISPTTQDIEDLTALTPAHFLIGSHLKVVPETCLLEAKENYLTRWQFVQQITQQFWRRWQQEYLNQLQQRQKWNQIKDNLKEGEMVIIKENNLPPNVWLLGRIVKTFPGLDGLNRVVEIKTKNGLYKRPITKICKLPIS